MSLSDSEKTGWPRGCWGWLFGSIALLVLGVVFGQVFGSSWLGLALAVLLSIGWLITYESWRGRNPGLHDPWDDGAQL
ncbi:hypothetical protein [Microbacterium lacticum]